MTQHEKYVLDCIIQNKPIRGLGQRVAGILSSLNRRGLVAKGKILTEKGKQYASSVPYQLKEMMGDQSKKPRVEMLAFDKPVASLYHYLCEVLEYDPFCQVLNSVRGDIIWANKMKDEMIKTYDGREKFLSDVTNTYNHEYLLSQDIQYFTFKYNDDKYVFLQIHTGVDIRTGYTQGRWFKIKDECEFFTHVLITGVVGDFYVEADHYDFRYEDNSKMQEGEIALNVDFQTV